ncbi:MAG TPA: sodium:proton antiporter [Chloroflexota bacterium]|nr:sodium:proton antiporter [Chloroflexota bacterium]
MEDVSTLAPLPLVGLTLVLGLRHGLDADHLSCIDGLTRFNHSLGRRIAPWCGTLFSVGHSLMIVLVATAIGLLARDFEPPAIFDTMATVVVVSLLLLIGTMNIWNLLNARPGEAVSLAGVKNRFLPKFVSRTSNPLAIVLIGFCFALAADTLSQAALFGIAGSAAHNYPGLFPTFLGLLFMVGMVTTDSLDGQIVYRMLSMASRTAWIATRITGWIVVALAYGVALYEIVNLLAPDLSVDSELLGVVVFCVFLVGFGLTITLAKREQPRGTSAASEEV